MPPTPHDRDILRRLADDMATTAALPIQKERIRLWTAQNDLKPERPMLWITEIPWREFEQDVDELRCTCESDACRRIESQMRKSLFTQRHLHCDEVAPDRFYVPKAISGGGYGIDARETQIAQGDSYISSHHYEPVIAGPEDIDKIAIPDVQHDALETVRRVAFANDLFGDIFPVEAAGPRQNFFNAWDDLVRWTGVTEALTDLVIRPDYIHALMRRITDSMLERMRQYDAMNLYSAPHPIARTGSGAAGYTHQLPSQEADPTHYRSIDLWGGATPQIFSEVSPAMHEEFALQYELEIMEKCGLNYYGCCEPLHNKMELMAKVPRLRKISVSPWCDVAKTRERAAQPYVFSHKPSPAILAEDTFNVDRARDDLLKRLDQSGDMPCEFIMKDVSTVRHDVKRVIDWCEMAHETVTG